jgi:hypothetical protein
MGYWSPASKAQRGTILVIRIPVPKAQPRKIPPKISHREQTGTPEGGWLFCYDKLQIGHGNRAPSPKGKWFAILHIHAPETQTGYEYTLSCPEIAHKIAQQAPPTEVWSGAILVNLLLRRKNRVLGPALKAHWWALTPAIAPETLARCVFHKAAYRDPTSTADGGRRSYRRHPKAPEPRTRCVPFSTKALTVLIKVQGTIPKAHRYAA